MFCNSSEDVLSIPIDVSKNSNYNDFTFNQLDKVNKRLVSLKSISKTYNWRYYIQIHYSSQTNALLVPYSYSSRNKFKVQLYTGWTTFNDTSLIVKVNGTVEVLSLTCESTGELNQAFQIYVSYYGNKSIPLIIDYDDGKIEYFTINDAQNDLNITKNYSTFGQFNIKANLSNDIGTCKVYINSLTGVSGLSKIFK
jgi:hypothetical protein